MFSIKPYQTKETCPICMEQYGMTESKSCVFNQCGHHICDSCIQQDYETRGKNSCAVCRQAIFVPPTCGITLRELLVFANDYSLDYIELYNFPQPRVFGRFMTRWLYAYVGCIRHLEYIPSDGPWRGSRAYAAFRKKNQL